jgi:ABC-type sugar transport system ATPase subunit
MHGTTMIYVTHDQVEAMTLADRIVVLNKGHVEQVGAPLELYADPDNLFVAQFIGSPAMNILPATLETTGDAIRARIGSGQAVVLPGVSGVALQGGQGHLGVRPEDLTLTDGAEALLSGTVTLVEPLGEVTLVYVDVGGAEPIVAKLPGAVHLDRGAAIRLKAEPDKIRLFGEDGRAVRTARRLAA